MILLAWNCRGLGHPRAVRALEELVKSQRSDVIFLSETLCKKHRIEEIRVKLGFEGAFAVDVDGRSAVLSALWRAAPMVTIVNYSRNFVNMDVTDGDDSKFHFTRFYGYPERQRRPESWEMLKSLRVDSPWICMGDFNDLMSQEEKKGIHRHPQNLIDGFKDAVSESGLLDVHMHGYKFTWSIHKGKPNQVEEKLDRALANSSWMCEYPDARLENHTATVSDHSPIIMHTKFEVRNWPARSFQFENKWLKEPNFRQIMEGWWDEAAGQSLNDRLNSCAAKMAVWGKELARKFREEIDALKHKLIILRETEGTIAANEYEECRLKLADLLQKEEKHWQQRAKHYWLTEGDLNTKYFHGVANGRRKRKQLT
ncbi:hypothetical protein LINPERHAP1_LOCUS12492 [Linum perenne]